MQIAFTASSHEEVLQQELAWLEQLVLTSYQLYFKDANAQHTAIDEVLPPALHKDADSPYAALVHQFEMTFAERAVLILSLAPYLRPSLLEPFMSINKNTGKVFASFGGRTDAKHHGFVPTLETACFILAGEDINKRLQLRSFFDEAHFFSKHRIVQLVAEHTEDLWLSGVLTPSKAYLHLLSANQAYHPAHNADFPAKLVSTEHTWQDVVLHPSTQEEIQEIEDWIQYGARLLDDMDLGHKLSPGYKSLFYGPPGTGKTLTACVLGNATGRKVFKVDLSLIVSKYIGETEKNLAKVFDEAEDKSWILFFDEADALFGKRTATRSSHDRHANQEVAYLLQRIEAFSGIVILATNLKENLDEAFIRRFQSIVHFPMPTPEERSLLWKKAFPPKLTLEPSIDLREIADRYETAGGLIMNVVRYCSIKALKRKNHTITLEDLEHSLRKELQKSGILLV